MTITNRSDLGILFQQYYQIGHGAEIGVKEGWNARDIMKHWKGTIHLVDIWKNLDDLFLCMINMRPYKFHVYQNRSEFIGLLPFQLDWVYIDAGHEYDEVFRDHHIWSINVRSGGIVSGHDYSPEFPGVVKFVDELIADGVDVHFTDDKFEGVNYNSWWYVK